MTKSLQFALVLSLLLPLAASAEAQPSKSGSFKSGFSSQRSQAPKPSFGSFGGSRQSTPAPPPRSPQLSKAPGGGFGSFGGAAAPAPQKSDSALSQKLDKNAQQANALRTLDERKAAQAARDARPVPGYENRQDSMPPPMQMPQPMPAPAPIIVRQDNSGLMSVITGFMLARATSGAHAGNNGYTGPVAGTASVNQPAGNEGGGFFTSVLRTFAWLLVVSVLGWLAFFTWKFLRRGKAQNKSNYAFERN